MTGICPFSDFLQYTMPTFYPVTTVSTLFGVEVGTVRRLKVIYFLYQWGVEKQNQRR